MIRVDVPPPGEFLALKIEAVAMDGKIKQAIRRVANKYRDEVRGALLDKKGGRTYRTDRLFGGARQHRASAPGEEPGSASGTMLQSLQVKMWKDGYGARVYASRKRGAFYRHMLEFGTRDRVRVRAKRARVQGKAGERKFRLLTAAERGSTGRIAPRPMWSPMQAKLTAEVYAAVVAAVDEFGRSRP